MNKELPTSDETPLNNEVTSQHLATRGLEEALETFIKQERELNEKAIEEGLTTERIIITSSWILPYAKTIVGSMYDTYFAPDAERQRPEISLTYNPSAKNANGDTQPRVNIEPLNKTAEILFGIVGENPEILGDA